jgi:hypothetical protein
MSVIAFNRSIGPVPIDCVVAENHSSEIEVTEIPIETGARITDHAYVLPKRVSLDIADRNAAAAYNALVRLQESRAPFTVVTGLFVYTNMLIKRLDAVRDKISAKILQCTADLQEIIIVGTAYTSAPGSLLGSLGSKTPGVSSAQSADAITADRATDTVLRGDSATSTSSDTSVLRQVL